MVIADFYSHIMNRLVGETGKMREDIKHFDWYNNQYLDPVKHDSFLRPAVFFELDPLQFQTLGMKRQAAEAIFRLHIVSDMLQEVAAYKDSYTRNSALQHLNVCDKIHYWLQNYSDGVRFGSIDRKGFTPDHNFDMLIVHLMEFRCRIVDDAAQHKFISVEPDPVVTIDLINPTP